MLNLLEIKSKFMEIKSKGAKILRLKQRQYMNVQAAAGLAIEIIQGVRAGFKEQNGTKIIKNSEKFHFLTEIRKMSHV